VTEGQGQLSRASGLIPQCDLAPYRGKGGGRGGLDDQFKTMLHSGSYTRFWRGVGFWSIQRVQKTKVWDLDDFAHYLRSRISWWVGR
jgi:hypothetical protein